MRVEISVPLILFGAIEEKIVLSGDIEGYILQNNWLATIDWWLPLGSNKNTWVPS